MTHCNMIHMAKNLYKAFHLISQHQELEHLSERDVHFSYFPLARVFERNVLTVMFYFGACIAFKHPDSRFFEDAQEVKPTILFIIPSDFTKLYAKYKRALSSWNSLKKWLFNIASQFKQNALLHYQKTPILDFFLFSKYAAHLGGNIRLIMASSQGHLPRIHKQFLQCIFCCPVIECYIRSETGIISCTTGKEDQFAGIPLCDIKLVDVPEYNFFAKTNGGEICIRGSNVSQSYENSELTASRVINHWFFTGEIGKWNQNDTLTVFGHKADLLEPSRGEFVL